MQFSARAAGGGKTWSVARGCGVRGRSWGAFCGGAEAGAHGLVCRSQEVNYYQNHFDVIKMLVKQEETLKPTWGVASSCASGPPSSAASRADGAAAPRPPAPGCGAAGSGGRRAGAAPAGRSCRRGGGRTARAEGRWARRGWGGATRAARGRCGG